MYKKCTKIQFFLFVHFCEKVNLHIVLLNSCANKVAKLTRPGAKMQGFLYRGLKNSVNKFTYYQKYVRQVSPIPYIRTILEIIVKRLEIFFSDFSDQFRTIIMHKKRIGYNLNLMR